MKKINTSKLLMLKKNKSFLFSILLFLAGFVFSYSQSKVITGVISDESNNPLENANVIAKPLQENVSLKFAIADSKGFYKLELENNIKYEINVSYIGFIEENVVIESTKTYNKIDFKLKSTGEKLKEIIIKHDYKPIVIKKIRLPILFKVLLMATSVK